MHSKEPGAADRVRAVTGDDAMPCGATVVRIAAQPVERLVEPGAFLRRFAGRIGARGRQFLHETVPQADGQDT